MRITGTISRLLDDRYAKSCIGALQTFAELYLPCSFYNPAYGDVGQCCNVKSGHNPKGHQNKQGKIIGHGDYESTFNAATFQPVWEHLIRASLVQVQSASFRLAHEFPDRSELQIAALLHQERLNELYSNNLGSALNFISYSSCLCCLRELPECALPCGHVLCLPCVETYGVRTSRTTIEISRCPIHVRDVIASPPWVIMTKPRYAGARTLCLDGYAPGPTTRLDSHQYANLTATMKGVGFVVSYSFMSFESLRRYWAPIYQCSYSST